ncbi:bifunctional 2-C-methyl-D-erythritol 4-phosphate cytidylyltransferase/2-C-methyl-D-erythritol 2,4-cyclodiphosphate synthase [Fimbriimonas ginsengisoli]|uniref:Bifunctional enzyme IspD/IspF n=1 Tax=Fimbriimonas ginsengisoli Gsoil 348 TaxID=661478 RepID=A0A068NT65_FIMGI|nr:bifunctional 2-C-methyl-D-erythritol 4-phosphate cytidylyltransferase/2-C-methyl-D-erythritol 2,4-cyclodiphosphate synthase [Fimbriimonas ginsengisoli]AIE86738.1 2-C-methyl-D-erythritol 4-phosphate cytidylyltransferase [Fimbriimonas ginsengisoli Gsoil 348]
MRIVAAILAAGKGERFGGDKTSLLLGGKPVWRWSYETYLSHPEVDRVMVVTAPERLSSLGDGVWAVPGGSTRQESSRAALEAAKDADVLLVHDAARPFTKPSVISAVIEGIREAGAAAAGLPATDTIKQVRAGSVTTLDRNELFAMQTPQGATVEILTRAHNSGTVTQTDEMSLVEAIGVNPRIVPGDPNNFKITTPEDIVRARGMLATETRTGSGYDVHSFSTDPNRTLWLGGVAFPDHPALDGHSDADALLHAITDALLGAAALGDIGQHFPNTDPRWRGEPSITFLRHAGSLLQSGGWRIVNIDATCIAESPKIMKRAEEIRATIAAALGIEPDRVSVKATTNERMGFIGRGEGIAAFATASIATVASAPSPMIRCP